MTIRVRLETLGTSMVYDSGDYAGLLGKALSELVVHGRCLFADLSALALSRFADTPPDWRELVGWIPAARSIVEAAAGESR